MALDQPENDEIHREQRKKTGRRREDDRRKKTFIFVTLQHWFYTCNHLYVWPAIYIDRLLFVHRQNRSTFLNVYAIHVKNYCRCLDQCNYVNFLSFFLSPPRRFHVFFLPHHLCFGIQIECRLNSVSTGYAERPMQQFLFRMRKFHISFRKFFFVLLFGDAIPFVSLLLRFRCCVGFIVFCCVLSFASKKKIGKRRTKRRCLNRKLVGYVCNALFHPFDDVYLYVFWTRFA